MIIGGSLHEREDEALLDAYAAARAAFPSAALVDRAALSGRCRDRRAARAGARPRSHAEVRGRRGGAPPPGARGVLVVDTVGELGTLYAVADIAFVGGSLFFRGANKGGHNLMEPAILAVPVLFGPYNFSFKETVDDLLAADAGRLVRDATSCARPSSSSSSTRDGGVRSGSVRQRVVDAGHGATARNYELLASCCGVAPLSLLARPRSLGLEFPLLLSDLDVTWTRSTSQSATSTAAPTSCS